MLEEFPGSHCIRTIEISISSDFAEIWHGYQNGCVEFKNNNTEEFPGTHCLETIEISILLKFDTGTKTGA